MYATFSAQDSAEIAVPNWDEQIVEEDEFGQPVTNYSDEYELPATASLWIAVTEPGALWNSRPLTEWEMYG
jgi:hypothetical protein